MHRVLVIPMEYGAPEGSTKRITMKTLKEQIAIMQAFADGKAVEVRLLPDGPWVVSDREDDIIWNWSAYDYRIAEPRIAKGHNPDKLTEEQVGVKDGWRLLEKDEIVPGGLMTSHIEAWGIWDGWLRCAFGANQTATYRTKLSKQDLAKERGLWKEPKVEIQWPAGTTADDWERVTDQEYVPKDGDLKVWADDGYTEEVDYHHSTATTVANYEDINIGGRIIHIYRRKRVPKMPDAPVWWVRTANRSFHSMPKIMNDGSGTTLGTWKQMQDAGCTWSPDRKRWFNFYGEEVK